MVSSYDGSPVLCKIGVLANGLILFTPYLALYNSHHRLDSNLGADSPVADVPTV